MSTKIQLIKVPIYITKSQLQKLNSKAKKEKSNRSVLVRAALDSYLT